MNQTKGNASVGCLLGCAIYVAGVLTACLGIIALVHVRFV